MQTEVVSIYVSIDSENLLQMVLDPHHAVADYIYIH